MTGTQSTYDAIIATQRANGLPVDELAALHLTAANAHHKAQLIKAMGWAE